MDNQEVCLCLVRYHPFMSATVWTCQLSGDVTALLSDAPRAVESFSPGHWDLMCRLERDACGVLQRRNVEEAAAFFADVAYLKRPHKTDRNSVRDTVLKHPKELLAAVDALVQVRALDYDAMDVVACVPGFGLRGGRSFNSAVLLLVCPKWFGIVDWRNVAVLCGSPGFDGLVIPPMVFSQFSRERILVERGYLPFTADVYRPYNDTLRSLGTVQRCRGSPRRNRR